MPNSDWRYTKLNPCPKCKRQPDFDLDELECRCDDCGYYVSSDTPDKLVKAWNQFASEPLEMELDKAVREHVEGVRNE